MPAGEALEDDYIITLLQKDAAEHKKRYSTVGSGPLLTATTRRPDAPKPNTRFLKNIIRETDSHNAALKAREEQDSRARLRELRRQESSGKRKREEGGEEKDQKRRKEREVRPGRWASALGLDGASDRSAGRGRREDKTQRRDRDGDKDCGGERDTHRHRHRRERSQDREAEPNAWKSRQERRNHPRERSRSPRHRKEHRRRHRSRSRSPPEDDQDASTATSDPLDESLGPQPSSQPLPRGRGALKSSTMDSRFREDYNPTDDVALGHDEEDDWDMALEALKARTKWRTQGAERLRAAGFTEEEIERWEKSGGGRAGEGGEKDVEDVRWRKKGERREWDRGKVVDGDGVELKAEWAN